MDIVQVTMAAVSLWVRPAMPGSEDSIAQLSSSSSGSYIPLTTSSKMIPEPWSVGLM